MVFRIPNEASATFEIQSEIDSQDIAILSYGMADTGAISGGTVVPNSGMQLTVTAGVVGINGTSYTYSSGTPTLSAADANFGRFDLVYVTTSATILVNTGTAAANPVYPTVSNSHAVLAAVYVPAGLTTVTSGHIVDKRVNLAGIFGGGISGGQTLHGGTAASNNLILSSTVDATNGVIGFESTSFNASVSGTNNRFTFATGDYLDFETGSNIFTFAIGSINKFRIDATQVIVGTDGSAQELILAAQDGTNAGGKITINGAAANADWSIDNNTGVIRVFTGATTPVTINTALVTFTGGITVNQTAQINTITSLTADTSVVSRRTSVATNDDPTEVSYQHRVATTDATVTSLATITIPNDTAVLIECTIVARRTGGASGAAQDSAGYRLFATVKGNSGTASFATGAPSTATVGEDQAGWDAVIDVTGSTARIRVTGAAGNNVTWHGHTRLRYLST